MYLSQFNQTWPDLQGKKDEKEFSQSIDRLTRCLRKIHRKSSGEAESEFALLELVPLNRPEPKWRNPCRPMQNSSAWWSRGRWKIVWPMSKDWSSSKWSSLGSTWWWRTSVSGKTARRNELSSGRWPTIYLSDEFSEVIRNDTIDSVIMVLVEDRIFFRITLNSFDAYSSMENEDSNRFLTCVMAKIFEKDVLMMIKKTRAFIFWPAVWS